MDHDTEMSDTLRGRKAVVSDTTRPIMMSVKAHIHNVSGME